jgi:tRNA pseudouridine55 synthase
MDGVLLIDKPAGPTSHDVVARIRRVAGQPAVGHTGTLDPAATGLLVLVLGRATRLASLLGGGAKTYDAAVRLGVATTTDDAEGTPVGMPSTSLPSLADVIGALEAFRGTYEQLPPRHSAKKVAGARAYDLARRDKPVPLEPATVTVHSLECLGCAREPEGEVESGEPGAPCATVRLRMSVGSGFYVRALARDLGARLGCGGHLASLRRTSNGPFRVEAALTLADAERAGRDIEQALWSPSAALPDLAAVTTTDAGLKRALHGNFLAPDHLVEPLAPGAGAALPVKILGPDGRLVAVARARGGALHPVVVLG